MYTAQRPISPLFPHLSAIYFLGDYRRFPPSSTGNMTSFRAFLTVAAPPLSSFSTTASFPTRPNTFPQRRLCKLGVKCSYAEAGISDDSRSDTIDVVADIKNERIVVLGGSGFVGSAICKAAVSKGIEVTSLSRSGRPTYSCSWVNQVNWIPGDVFYANWNEVLVGATAVVSTLGGFGSEEQMKRINGEANAMAVNAAKDFGIPKFILISVHDYNLPSFLLSSGYFTGKRKAESEVLSKYPNSGVVLRPGFIYGKRRVDGFELPLDLVGEPLEKILSAVENFTKPLSSLPASDLILAPPVCVDDVAYAVINAIRDDVFGVFTIEQIKEAAEKVKV
ncbi:uncharacterized protein At1g32220, chloroplastic-like [Hibiscus syriacus]|uniref:uncharacterized protein At1g32220, chloroplastic-like n=1 Tax=Hibiscus syriacus TaxID=106335 RepID=UPI001921AF84|nr:uncharacterized protein At1g32220, chloroplastic-like [Hibiscus syriacus]